MIRLLSKETIDKIAAGEVVDRPESVVRELLDNAIDSGAGKISLEIRAGGIQLVRWAVASDPQRRLVIRREILNGPVELGEYG